MTQDEIIEMAVQAGLYSGNPRTPSTGRMIEKRLEAFAKLIAAKERESLLLFLRNLADDHTPTDCADMICALQSLGAIRARGEA